MRPAAGVERGVTPGTGVVVGLPLAVTGRSPVARGTLSLAARGTLRLSVAVEVLAGGERRPANAAQHRRLVEPVTGPRLGLVVGRGVVARVTG